MKISFITRITVRFTIQVTYSLLCSPTFWGFAENHFDLIRTFESFLRVSLFIINKNIIDYNRRLGLELVFKRLFGKQIVDLYCIESTNHQENYAIQDGEEVLVIEVRPSPIQSDQIIGTEIANNQYISKQMFIKLMDQESELLVQIICHPSCELFLEMKTSVGTGMNKTRFLS